MDFGSYVQVVKTTDAELRGFRNLEPGIKKDILPLFELTRSRSTKIVPDGDIYRRVEDIKKTVPESWFILDLTSHEDLLNYQIEDLLDEEEGFREWTDFVTGLELPGLIPAIHVYEDGDEENILLQVQRLSESFERLAFRVPADDQNLEWYLRHIVKGLRDKSQLLIVIDAEYVSNADVAKKKVQIEHKLRFLTREHGPVSLCVVASSFPQYVVNLDGCEDDQGEIPILEWRLFLELRREFKDLIYGDYGSVHPVRYQSRGGSWVPRIDYPLIGTIIYSRIRRHEGGYVECARNLVDFSEYDALPCWGTAQIEDAAEGEPNGKNPAFWIAVRVNIHSTRKVSDLKKLNTS